MLAHRAAGGTCAPDQMLQAGISSNTGSPPRYMQVADFNNGGFGAPVTTPLGATAAGLGVADLTLDKSRS